MVTRQRLKLGKKNAGKLVTVIIGDTHFRILHEGEEIAVKERRNSGPHQQDPSSIQREDSQEASSMSREPHKSVAPRASRFRELRVRNGQSSTNFRVCGPGQHPSGGAGMRPR